MKINKNIFICALLVLMLLVCVNAVSADESLNETLGADTVDEVVVADAPVEELSANGDTLVVDANGGGDYTSISAAVSAASGGETIFIKNGEYTETSKIDIGTKQLTFTGESQDGVIIKSGDNDLFYTTGSEGASLVISGLTFKDISMTGARVPIFIGGNDNVEITDCTFDNCASRYGALRIFTSGTVTVDNCKFLGTKSSTGSYSSAIDFGGSGTADYTLKNSIIDGSEISSTTTASYIFGAIYNEKTTGLVTLDNVTICNCNLASANGIISTKGNMNIKNSRIVNNNVQRDLAIGALFFVSGAKDLTIETSVIANNSGPNNVLSANSASATVNLNYNNIQNNSYNTAFTYTDGTYTLDYNYWGSNDAPAGVTVNDYAIYENGEFKLNSGAAMEKEIPDLNSASGPDYIYVSPDGDDDSDGSSKDAPTTLQHALEIAPEGGSIFLCNGEYDIEALFISQSVNLIGESREDVILTTSGGAFIIGNPQDPMSPGYAVDYVSLSKMTIESDASDFMFVPADMIELSITDCVITSSGFVKVGYNVLGDHLSDSTGTLNFKKNIIISDDEVIGVTGQWNANINDNIFLNSNSGENTVINEDGEGTIDVDYNYWGSNTPATDLDVSNYIIVDVKANASEIYTDESAKITIKATLDDGETSAADHLPDYPIEATLSAGGSLSQSELALVNGAAEVTYSSDVARNDNIMVEILGQTLTVPIKVLMPIQPLAETVLSAEDLEMRFKDGSAWTVTLTDGTNPIEGVAVKVGILGKTYTLTTGADGTVSLPVNVAPGTYDVNATFEGDESYEASFVNATVTVGKAVSTLTAEDVTLAYKNGSWIVTLTGAEGVIPKAPIKFGILGKVYTIVTDENGVASLPINLAPGTYTVNATFDGNYKHEAAFVEATVTVEKATATIASEDLTMCYKDGSSYAVTVTDANGAALAGTTVKFTIGTKSYNIKTDENGVASLPINLNVGEYTVKAVVDDAKYTSEEATNAITVTEYDAVLVANNVTMTYQDGTNYEVQLTTADGTPIAVANLVVKITLLGKTYNIKTDAEGIAKLPINLKAGTYELTAEYNGNQVNSTVVVNKA